MHDLQGGGIYIILLYIIYKLGGGAVEKKEIFRNY